MDVIAMLDQARAATDVLEHPFYQRWTEGRLSASELGCYAGQYRHAVVALARASALAAEKAPQAHAAELKAHAEEEATHVELWEQFARATRIERAREAPQPARNAGEPASDAGEPALAQTRTCVAAWTAGEDLLEHLAVLYALEAGQPEVSRTKLAGLCAHYGYTEEGPAVEYFSEHLVRDREHARQARELIERLFAEAADPQALSERMLTHARAALHGNWALLDGVEEASRESLAVGRA